MRKTKTVQSMLFITTIVLVMVNFAALPVAASTSKARTFTISSGKTTVYADSALTKKSASVTGSQELEVVSISQKSCKISYKENGKTKNGYVATKAILCGTGTRTCEVSKKLTAYRRPGGKTCGTVSKGSKVRIMGTKGAYTQIRFTQSGKTRFAFVKTKELNQN